MVTGSVALLEPVPKAVVMALAMLAINRNGKVRVTTANISGSTTNPWTNNPESIACNGQTVFVCGNVVYTGITDLLAQC